MQFNKRTHTRGRRRKKRIENKVLVQYCTVDVDPDNLENSISISSNRKEAGREAQGPQVTQGLSKNCASRGSVSPLSCLIRNFRTKYLSLIPPLLGRTKFNASVNGMITIILLIIVIG